MMLFYICSREFNITPYLIDEKKQFYLKISGFLFLGGAVTYFYSWNLWGREFSHFLLALIPGATLIKESFARKISSNEIVFFSCNLVGMFSLLAIPDSYRPFTYLGLAVSTVGVMIIYLGYWLMGEATGNVVSMGMIYNLLAIVFLPTFFAVQRTEPVSIFRLIIIAMLGVLTFCGVVFGIRSSQIMKRSHFLLFASVSLAVINLGRGYKTDGFTYTSVIGTILSIFGTIMMLINESFKTEVVGN